MLFDPDSIAEEIVITNLELAGHQDSLNKYQILRLAPVIIIAILSAIPITRYPMTFGINTPFFSMGVVIITTIVSYWLIKIPNIILPNIKYELDENITLDWPIGQSGSPKAVQDKNFRAGTFLNRDLVLLSKNSAGSCLVQTPSGESYRVPCVGHFLSKKEKKKYQLFDVLIQFSKAHKRLIFIGRKIDSIPGSNERMNVNYFRMMLKK